MYSVGVSMYTAGRMHSIGLIIIITMIINDLYSAFRFEDTEARDAAQEN